MRIRTIKPEFFTHEGLYELEKETGLPIRVAFPGLWCAADKAGRFKWEPRRLGVLILPYDGIDFARVLDALFTRGFIVRYRVEEVDYGAIPAFEKHQFLNNKEKASCFPAPDFGKIVAAPKGKEGERKGMDIARAEDASGTREPRVNLALPKSPLLEIEGFREELESFINHRKKLKKPLTERAIELTLMELGKRPEDAIAALQMIMRKGWQSIEWAWFDKENPSAAAPISRNGAYDHPSDI